MTAPGVNIDEAHLVAAKFGVAIEQIRRDHLISHILAALSNHCRDQLIFFGGTALARSHVPDGRLSEDIDLISVGSRPATAAAIERTLSSALRRSHGRITWAPALAGVRDTDPAVLVAADGQLAVRIQLLNALGYPAWPTEIRAWSSDIATQNPRRYGCPLSRRLRPGRQSPGSIDKRPATSMTCGRWLDAIR